MRLPIRPIEGRWPAVLQRRLARFFWPDPALLVADSPDGAQFRRLMSQVYVGGTIKITGTNRHPEADDLLLEHVDLSQASIADVGASDGSTSLDLIDKIGDFRSFTIADLHLSIRAVRRGGRLYFFDHEDTCVLIGARRYAAWPDRSPLVGRLFRSGIAAARTDDAAAVEALLINPDVRHRMAEDSRISTRRHDVFTRWEGEPLDAIKVANLLRRLYFSDSELTAGLGALTGSLREGGHLLIAENPRSGDLRHRGGLYRRVGDRLEVVAQTDPLPEVEPLIPQVRALS